jgi:hypothetical protein
MDFALRVQRETMQRLVHKEYKDGRETCQKKEKGEGSANRAHDRQTYGKTCSDGKITFAATQQESSQRF